MSAAIDSCQPDTAWLSSLETAWQIAYATLQTERNAAGHWTGELSTSALSTATAISALAQARKSGAVTVQRQRQVDTAISVGCQWLSEQQNDDGGFGDTNRSYSNIATTLLVLAAWELASQAASPANDGAASSGHGMQGGQGEGTERARQRSAAWEYVERQGKWDGHMAKTRPL
jgi:hypothetical protein